MPLIYNKTGIKERRRELRKNQTDVERLLWKQIRNKNFFGLKFFRQYSVGAYIVDFYCPKLKLAIELDGGQHAEEGIKEYDKIRTDYLKLMGIKVMRFWNNDVIHNIEGVLEEINKNQPLPASPLNTRGGERLDE